MSPTAPTTRPVPTPRALVVGAGIGGLAAAIAVRDAGWDVTVLERGPRSRALGSGLALWPNGVRSLRALGLGDALDAIAMPVPAIAIRGADGRVLTRYDGAALARRWGAPLLAVHRSRLLMAELEHLGPEAVHHRADVELVDDGGVRLTDGTVLEADLVVGADGLRSVTRQALICDGPPRPAGLVAFRGVTTEAGSVPAGEWWGAGAIAGVLPLAGGDAYWYVACDARDEAPVATLANRFADPVPDLVAATPPGTVLRHELADRRPSRRLVGDRIALLGDAAHPMLPFLGQGACSAVDDAVCLGRALAAADLQPALRRYERERRGPTARLVRGSRSAARVAIVRSALVRAARDGLVATTPPAVHLRQLGRRLQLPRAAGVPA